MEQKAANRSAYDLPLRVQTSKRGDNRIVGACLKVPLGHALPREANYIQIRALLKVQATAWIWAKLWSRHHVWSRMFSLAWKS